MVRKILIHMYNYVYVHISVRSTTTIKVFGAEVHAYLCQKPSLIGENAIYYYTMTGIKKKNQRTLKNCHYNKIIHTVDCITKTLISI